MKDFVIMTDSCCDLPRKIVEDKNIPYVSLICSYNGKEYVDNFWKDISPEDFYNDVENGALPKTSQPNSERIYEEFKKYIQQNKDIIFICISSRLSGTINSANFAKIRIEEEYEDAKICIIDSITVSLGEGIMVLEAYKMKEEGKSFDEIVEKLENEKKKNNVYITVDDLSHLKRGGRISSTAAVFGTVLHIKPILVMDNIGRIIPFLKVKGRKKVFNKIAEIVAERIENPEEQTIAICHGNCIEEAEKLKQLLLQSLSVKDILINNIGPVVGTYGGFRSLAVFFKGKER